MQYQRNFQPQFQNVVGLGVNLDQISGKRLASVIMPGESQPVIKQVQDHVLYDSTRIINGTATVAGKTVRLFDQKLGASVTTFNTTGVYNKTYFDTNLDQGNGGSLAQGNAMIINSIQVHLVLPAALDTTQFGITNTINPTRAAAGSNDGSAENLLRALQEMMFIRFTVDNRYYERGPAGAFPCMSGQFGTVSIAGTPASNALALSGVVTNSLGPAKRLSVPHVLPPLVPFGVEVICQDAITIPQDVLFRVDLVGTLFTPVG